MIFNCQGLVSCPEGYGRFFEYAFNNGQIFFIWKLYDALEGPINLFCLLYICAFGEFLLFHFKLDFNKQCIDVVFGLPEVDNVKKSFDLVQVGLSNF